MRINATLGAGQTRVRALIDHPMESGLRTDSRGNTISANYIREVSVKHGERLVMTAQWGPSLSRNPYLSFEFAGGEAGDEVTLEWIDNRDENASRTVIIEENA